MVSVKFNAFPYTLHYFATSLKHSERHSTTKRLKSLNIYRKSIELWYMLTTYCRCPGRLLNLYRISCPHQFWYFSGSLCRYCFLDFRWSLRTPDYILLFISCGRQFLIISCLVWLIFIVITAVTGPFKTRTLFVEYHLHPSFYIHHGGMNSFSQYMDDLESCLLFIQPS